MSKVFLGGSRRMARLNAEVRQRIDNVVAQGFTILIGDANGADRTIQEYLARKQYSRVTVYCTGSECRNNVGGWTTEFVPTDRRVRDFVYYAQKDAKMGRDADYGFFLWDEESRGTLNNIVALVTQNKSALVYLSPRKVFVTIESTGKLNEVVAQCGPRAADALRRTMEFRGRSNDLQPQFDFLPSPTIKPTPST